METVSIKNVLPDENQPRRFFDAVKMATLRESINQHGIMTPLIVEEIGTDKYLLIDGERRFRAATELGLKQIPVIIEKASSETERLVRQFNVQEQHEAWTPVEKAMSIIKLAEEMGTTLDTTCKLLNVAARDRDRYTAFAGLADRNNYQKSEIPLEYAAPLRSLTNQVRSIYLDHFEKEFTRNDQKKLEASIIRMVKTGGITKRPDLVRIKDAFTKSPGLVEKMMNGTAVTTDGMFLESKASGAFHLRNASANAGYLSFHAQKFLTLRDVKMSPQQLANFKRAAEFCKQLIDLAE